MNPLVERLRKEATEPPEHFAEPGRLNLERFAALVAQECARQCDDEQRVRTLAANQHDPESAERDRCYAGARGAINCGKAIRSAFPMPKG